MCLIYFLAANTYIEVDGKVHNFTVGDKSHPMSQQIYEKIREVDQKIRNVGYTPNTSWIMHNVNVGEEQKEEHLSYHRLQFSNCSI